MSGFARPCLSCGRRTVPGETYCERCRPGTGTRRSTCRVCGARTAGGPYCAAHAGEALRVADQPWRAAYRDPAYRRNRAWRYEIAGGRCESCGAALPDGWQCDHVVPLRDGGTHAAHNLRVYCPACHAQKTATDRRRRTAG